VSSSDIKSMTSCRATVVLWIISFLLAFLAGLLSPSRKQSSHMSPASVTLHSAVVTVLQLTQLLLVRREREDTAGGLDSMGGGARRAGARFNGRFLEPLGRPLFLTSTMSLLGWVGGDCLTERLNVERGLVELHQPVSQTKLKAVADYRSGLWGY
jgi:hypothetical protein